MRALPAEDVADAPDAAVAGLAAVAACRQVNVSARIVSEEEGAVGATFVKALVKKEEEEEKEEKQTDK